MFHKFQDQDSPGSSASYKLSQPPPPFRHRHPPRLQAHPIENNTYHITRFSHDTITRTPYIYALPQPTNRTYQQNIPTAPKAQSIFGKWERTGVSGISEDELDLDGKVSERITDIWEVRVGAQMDRQVECAVRKRVRHVDMTIGASVGR